MEEELKYSDAKLKQSDANLKHSDAERKRAQDAKVALEVNVRATREAYEKQLQEARVGSTFPRVTYSDHGVHRTNCNV